MNGKARITYRDFYDVPRVFVTHYRGMQILFDGKFDEAKDEYSETYRVYVLPDLADEILNGSWMNLSDLATRFLGEVAVKDVTFDSSKRQEIDTGILDTLVPNSD
jgi:hypothetical protein